MASSASGQYAVNPVFWLATRAGKMERYCPPGTARFVPANKISPKFKRVHERLFSPRFFSAEVERFMPYNKSFIDQASSNPQMATLNKRNELVSTCRHRRNYILKYNWLVIERTIISASIYCSYFSNFQMRFSRNNGQAMSRDYVDKWCKP